MLQITPIPAFNDNYIWLLQRADRAQAVVVDPGDAAPVLAACKEQGLELTTILITHHHRDHVGGVPALLQAFPVCSVFGPADSRIPQVTNRVDEGGLADLPELDAQFTVMEVPGHTSSHIAYRADDVLFCGDTLFAAGCGRVFDGTFEQLSASLRRIAELPVDTLLYCAHEYTLDNLGFAKWVEPESAALARRESADRQSRAQGQSTVPSLLELELATNPFLRTADADVVAAAEHYAGHSLSGHAEVFRALREWKDREYD